MIFARKVWHLLVGIKDGLVLLFMLLFFGLLYAVLAMRPGPGAVTDGALLLRLKGPVVEEPASPEPLAVLSSGSLPSPQYRARDLVRALDAAVADRRIKAVVLDLSDFTGGGFVHMAELGAAMDRVRAAKKPVLTYATGYDDAAVLLAAHASEAWINPMGALYVLGPGGQQQYFKALLDKLRITVHVYKVGTFKDAIEPWERDSMSDASRQARTAVVEAVFGQWQANVRAARPKARLDLVIKDPVGWMKGSGGDPARAALASGLVDRIGDRVEFGQRVAAIAGKDAVDDRPGRFAHSSAAALLAAHPLPTGGRKIGVLTIAGDIVDGAAGPGAAGGDRVAALIDGKEGRDLAGLVVRVDSPGGSVMASEQIRKAIVRAKARGIPVAVSMANYAASGGYWVSTPAARIFAEPGTVTGSIGIFAVLPSFERSLAAIGVKSDGVRITPLSGQPDVLGGFTPQIDGMLQAGIESGYARFVGLVARSRGKSFAEIDRIAQGRVWDGGTARQLGLVDQFGTLDDALAWVAGQAKLGKGDWHPVYLGENANPYASLLERLAGSDDGAAPETDAVARLARLQQGRLGSAMTMAERLMGAQGAQALCLACPALPVAQPTVSPTGWWAGLAALVR
ncbi:signal peptide peptidase SppA [Novosphingobium bradum]|uniref:Signal peptide peptidase SppA n=1 Tax=Novosphingobium bradum TaxID=1737444 RepID=A0ABV7IMI9_9SPHN